MDQLMKDIKKTTLCKKLAYTARLDPMARGIVPILIDEECLNIKSHLYSNKVYQVKIIIGIKTDSDDVLGLITKFSKFETVKSIFDDVLRLKNYLSLITLNIGFEQKYHYWSTKMLNHRKKHNYMPFYHNVTIYKIEIIDGVEDAYTLSTEEYDIESGLSINTHVQHIPVKKFTEKIIKNILLIDPKKNFRQAQIIEQWKSFSDISDTFVPFIKCRLSVSSGFFVRQFVSDCSEILNISLTAYDIHRISIN